MVKHVSGILVTCDRCGKEEFFQGNLPGHGWGLVFSKVICPKCNDELTERIDDFMDVDDSELYFEMLKQFMSEKSGKGE